MRLSEEDGELLGNLAPSANPTPPQLELQLKRSSPGPSPIQVQNRKNPSARSSAGPQGCLTSELLGGAATFQTPEVDAIDQWFENIHHYEVTLEEMAAPSLDVNFKEELSAIRADPIAALLSPAVGEAKLASMNLKSSGLKSTCPPSDGAATLSQQRATLKAAGNAAHRVSASALASSGERGTWAGVLGRVAEWDNSPTQEISVGPRSSRRPQSTDFSGLSAGSAFRSPRPDGSTTPGPFDKLSPIVGDTFDLTAAKLNDLYGSNNVPCLDGPDKFRRPSKGHIHDSSSGSNNGVTNNGVYGDLIQGHHAHGVGRLQSGFSRGLRNGGGDT
ncbi:hypothetical protein EDB83DRAFT_2322445 [Lactarius deliciosus]|nr:hypothetical protein EDB83DRAFT_2322445 [Lactarius deliciosus]